jgi:hypothetical protein
VGTQKGRGDTEGCGDTRDVGTHKGRGDTEGRGDTRDVGTQGTWDTEGEWGHRGMWGHKGRGDTEGCGDTRDVGTQKGSGDTEGTWGYRTACQVRLLRHSHTATQFAGGETESEGCQLTAWHIQGRGNGAPSPGWSLRGQHSRCEPSGPGLIGVSCKQTPSSSVTASSSLVLIFSMESWPIWAAAFLEVPKRRGHKA